MDRKIIPLPTGAWGETMKRKPPPKAYEPPPPLPERLASAKVRGNTIQAFLLEEEKAAVEAFLKSLGGKLTKGDWLRWLVTDAVENRRVPPGWEKRLPKEE
jgi:hypothetical protein